MLLKMRIVFDNKRVITYDSRTTVSNHFRLNFSCLTRMISSDCLTLFFC